jgi:hypothetical protein
MMQRTDLSVDVAGTLHDGLVASATLRKFGNERVPIVVPPAFDFGIPPHRLPGGLERGEANGFQRLFLFSAMG